MAGLFSKAEDYIRRMNGLLAPVDPTATPPAPGTTPGTAPGGLLAGLNSPLAQVGLRMMMASGRQPGPRQGLGSIIGGSVLGYQSDAEQQALKRLQADMLKAQMEKMKKTQLGRGDIVIDEAGKTVASNVPQPVPEMPEWSSPVAGSVGGKPSFARTRKDQLGYFDDAGNRIVGFQPKDQSPLVSVNLPNGMEKEWATRLDTQYGSASDAVAQLQSIQEARKQLDAGIISGFAANPRLVMARALNLAGANDTETIANTEAFLSTTAQQVAQVIKQFGAGTGLSDADREYAARMVGGDITLNEDSIRKIIDINEKLAKAKIKIYNDQRQRGVRAYKDLGLLYPEVAPPEQADGGWKTVNGVRIREKQ